MANAQIATGSTIISSLLGFQAISLTAFTTSAQSLIAAGSKVELGGAYFTFSGNETPQASTWTAITTGTTAYLTLTPSGTAGSQILTAKYAQAAPVWSTSKQGWYTTAASIVRYVGGVHKASATRYTNAFVFEKKQRTNPQLEYKVLEIGDWDMDADTNTSVNHGLADSQIRNVEAVIRADSGTAFYKMPVTGSAGTAILAFGSSVADSRIAWGGGSVALTREGGSIFDTVDFDSTSFNRGWVTVWYTA